VLFLDPQIEPQIFAKINKHNKDRYE